jgi:hypothetical protein
MQLPAAQATRAVIQRYARLHHRYRADFGSRPFVLPNAEYFPDEFVGDAASTALLSLRMQEHAGLADVPIDCRVVAAGTESPATKSCGSGGCEVPQTAGNGVARLVDSGDSWILQVPAQELRHPVALTTNIARSLAYVFLIETKLEGETLEPPLDVTADLVAVGLGFGALMLQGSYIYAKSCGGPQIASVTKLGVAELAISTALFAHLGGHELAPALKTLDVTQKAALSEAHRLVKANRKLLLRLAENPHGAAGENFELSEPGDFFGSIVRKIGRKRDKADPFAHLDPNMALEEIESLLIDMPPSSRASRPRPSSSPSVQSDELKSLVADALSDARARA